MNMTAPQKPATGYSVARALPQCHTCGKAIAPGDKIMAALRETPLLLERVDICPDCWAAHDKTGLLGFWQTIMPQSTAKKKIFVDDDVLCELFERLGDATEQSKINFRFMLGLILMRKRRIAYESSRNENEVEIWSVRFRGREEKLDLVNPKLNEQQVGEVSTQLERRSMRGDLKVIQCSLFRSPSGPLSPRERAGVRALDKARNLQFALTLTLSRRERGPEGERGMSWRWVTLFVSIALSACAPNTPPPAKGYFGDTDPIDTVAAAINANNSKIPTFWSHHDFEATIVDENHKSHFVNGYGTLLYSAPNSVRLTAKKEVTDLFDMGSNDQQFWLHMIPDKDVIYWGNVKNIGKPGMRQIPIRPDLVLQVLGISQFNPDLTQEPVPVMRFNNDADAYMFVWQVHAGDRWLAQKEIWYDRATQHPSLVLIFDEKGRVVLRAWLSNYQAVHVDNVDAKDWPQMATRYRLFFPDTGTKMSFNLSDLTLTHNGFPKAASFRLPNLADLSDSGVKVIQIDADCGP
jgi:hypothetical protein